MVKLIFFLLVNTTLWQSPNTETFDAPCTGGVITMEDDILNVDTETSDEIINVAIFSDGVPLVVEDGCGGSYCRYDMHKYPSGIYQITVTTSSGCTFAKQIMI